MKEEEEEWKNSCEEARRETGEERAGGEGEAEAEGGNTLEQQEESAYL